MGRSKYVPRAVVVVRCKDGKYAKVPVNRGSAIRMMCTECLGWGEDPMTCTDRFCPLRPFRGKSLKGHHGKMGVEDARDLSMKLEREVTP